MNLNVIKQTANSARSNGMPVLIRTRLHHVLLVFVLAWTVQPLHTAFSAESITEKHSALTDALKLIEKQSPSDGELQKAAKLLERAHTTYPKDVSILNYLAKAYYLMADSDKDIDQEFPYYEKVGAYAKKAIEMNPDRAEGHYWYGLFLLKKAQKIGGLEAFFIVKDGVRQLQTVRNLMPQYDHAGASRVLGLLYCRAPEWTPFGNIDKCIQLAEESIHIAPNHPLNRLYLANAYKKRGDKEAAIREYLAILPELSAVPQGEKGTREQEIIKKLKSLNQLPE